MRALDASSALFGWDNYPLEVFPTLWSWLAGEVAAGRIVLCEVAFEEVDRRSSDCSGWLLNAGVTNVPLTQQCLACAAAMERRLEIDRRGYHPKGVGSKDLLITASAKTHAMQLVSNEERQEKLPHDSRR